MEPEPRPAPFDVRDNGLTDPVLLSPHAEQL